MDHMLYFIDIKDANISNSLENNSIPTLSSARYNFITANDLFGINTSINSLHALQSPHKILGTHFVWNIKIFHHFVYPFI